MKSKTALLNLFIAVFAMSIPGVGTINNFMNILLAAYAGIFAVAFVYDNLTDPVDTWEFYKLKLLSAIVFMLGTPAIGYAYLWQILVPVGFNQTLVLIVLMSIFYIPLVIIAWLIFTITVALLGID